MHRTKLLQKKHKFDITEYLVIYYLLLYMIGVCERGGRKGAIWKSCQKMRLCFSRFAEHSPVVFILQIGHIWAKRYLIMCVREPTFFSSSRITLTCRNEKKKEKTLSTMFAMVRIFGRHETNA